jgi:hypothetical protein
MGSVYFGTANGPTRLPTATYALLTLPIIGRSRHTIGISIPQTIGRIRAGWTMFRENLGIIC